MVRQLLALEEEEVIRDSDDEDDEFVTGDVKEAMAQDRSAGSLARSLSLPCKGSDVRGELP